MSYNDYKQQYTYGFGPVSLPDLGSLSSASTKFFLGEAFGPKANLSKTTNDSTNTKPICYKAGKQFFYQKSVLDIEVIEAIGPLGTKQVVTLTIASAAGSAGKHTIAIVGETPVAVDIANSTTAANAAAAVATALAGLKNWTATNTAGQATVVLTKKVEGANITVNSTNFSFSTTVTTQTGSFASTTAGVAPEADGHNIKLDFKSADEAGLDAYLAGGDLDPDMTVYVKAGEAVVCNTPYFQSLMPSNTKEYSWVEISVPYAGTSSISFTGGKLVIHCNPN